MFLYKQVRARSETKSDLYSWLNRQVSVNEPKDKYLFLNFYWKYNFLGKIQNIKILNQYLWSPYVIIVMTYK